jgi:hypothetical protein
MEIELGQKVKDTITGMEGIVISRTVWLNGCVRVGVQPQQLKDGIPVESQIFDEPQLVVVEDTSAPQADPRHGPRSAVARAPDPTRR